MKKYLLMSSAAVVIGALRANRALSCTVGGATVEVVSIVDEICSHGLS